MLPTAGLDDRDDEIMAFNELVCKHRVGPGQAVCNQERTRRLSRLQEEAKGSRGIEDIGCFMKTVVWPSVLHRSAVALQCIGFHMLQTFVPQDQRAALEAQCTPESGMWRSETHGQNREVWTFGATLKDREMLVPAPCAMQPLPSLVQTLVLPRVRAELKALGVQGGEDLDFLYVNRYCHSRQAFIRFHHDHLTKMGTPLCTL